MKAVKAKLQETNPDRIEAFEKGAAGFAKKVVGNFKDFEFYTGESMNPDGMIALLVSGVVSTFSYGPRTNLPHADQTLRRICRITERTERLRISHSGKMVSRG